MRTRTRIATAFVTTAITALATGGVAPAAGAQDSTARPPKRVTVSTRDVIALPGVGGHGDVVTVDPTMHVAYIAHSPDNDVVVLDTTRNTVKTVLPDIPAANGIAFTRQYLFVAAATANAVKVISKATWKTVAYSAIGRADTRRHLCGFPRQQRLRRQ